MTKKKTLTRDVIIQTLADALKALDYVYAFYEGGAVAFDRIDEWSDIDLYLVVDDDKVDETFLAVERALKSLSRIKQKYETPQLPWPGVSQAFYRLEDTSEYLVIDLAVMKLSSTERFLEPEIHGNAVFHFNKSNDITPPRLDKDKLVKKLFERLRRLQAKFAMFNGFVQKEINRTNYLEALDLYHAVTLASLTEALRIKYNPIHYDFKMRYIHYELPPETLEKLRHLYYVKDEKELQEKYLEASQLFARTMLEIDSKEIERLVKMP